MSPVDRTPEAGGIERPVCPAQADQIRSWSAETDVLVVGYGCAGASAAVEAKRAGADVLIVEGAGGSGGASALSGGLLYLGGGTEIQKACRISDTPAQMFSFLVAALGPGADEQKIAVYCDGSVEHFDWLVGLGVPFKAKFLPLPHLITPPDVGLVWLGENSYPFCDIAVPAPRGHRPAAEGLRGWLLMARLAHAVATSGVSVLTDTKAERLIVGRDGRVVGVQARRYGQEVAVLARRGVILAGGGFVSNEAMLARYAPRLAGHGKVGADSDDGRTINMALAVGAVVQHMEAAEAAINFPPALMPPSIIVNAAGQRFINEDTYPGRIGQAALFHQDAAVFLICDGKAFEALAGGERMGRTPSWVGESVVALEAEMQLPEGSLQATMTLYNRHAARGHDPVFHKDGRWVRPLEPPLGAFPVGGPSMATPDGPDMSSGFGVFTLGGVRTSIDGEVLDVDDQVIPGLLAAGRATSGLQAAGYISGTSLGDGTFFGRRAGRHAAQSPA
jgi:3-oxo-5alpha-steroid 4-dehydrogenase